MRYYCKVVYKDKIEPTVYLEDEDENDIKEKLTDILKEFFDKENISGIFVGKKE